MIRGSIVASVDFVYPLPFPGPARLVQVVLLLSLPYPVRPVGISPRSFPFPIQIQYDGGAHVFLHVPALSQASPWFQPAQSKLDWL